MSPRIAPDSWKAQGRDTTAVPIMVFQQLKMTTREDCFSPGSAVAKIFQVRELFR